MELTLCMGAGGRDEADCFSVGKQQGYLAIYVRPGFITCEEPFGDKTMQGWPKADNTSEGLDRLVTYNLFCMVLF